MWNEVNVQSSFGAGFGADWVQLWLHHPVDLATYCNTLGRSWELKVNHGSETTSVLDLRTFAEAITFLLKARVWACSLHAKIALHWLSLQKILDSFVCKASSLVGASTKTIGPSPFSNSGCAWSRKLMQSSHWLYPMLTHQNMQQIPIWPTMPKEMGDSQPPASPLIKTSIEHPTLMCTMAGSRKAKVLPEPVSAMPTSSWTGFLQA